MSDNLSYEALKEILQKRLNEKRYFHSLCVADEAKRLAEKYGGDAEKCYLSGLLHDITKNAPNEEHLQIFETFGIMLNEIEKNAKKLWHAISGSAYIKFILGIEDDELLDAVRYHTTGRANMTLIEKLLYLADYIEPTRIFNDCKKIREYFYTNTCDIQKRLNDTIVLSLKYTISDLLEKGEFIHPKTLECYNALVKITGDYNE